MSHWLEQNEALILLYTMAGSIVVLVLAELAFPRRQDAENLGFRWVNNIGLAVCTLLCNRFYQTALGIGGAWFATANGLGLLSQIQVPWPVALLIAFVFFDFINYFTHRVLHAFPALWRLHAVHHSDTSFDLTTTYRNHPFAVLFIVTVRLPFIILLGAPVSVIVAVDAFVTAHEMWSHSNTGLPRWLDRWVSKVLVTPDFHRVHHTSDIRYTNSNYASTLSCFDYIFGTYQSRPFAEHEHMEIGLEYLRDPRETRLDRLLLMPFSKEFGHARTGDRLELY